VHHRWPIVAFFGAAVAACDPGEHLEEPRQVIAAEAEAKRSTFPFVFVGTEADFTRFVGCYEVDLGPRFPRPVGWPSTFTIRLTEKPGHLQAWMKAEDSFSTFRQPDWAFRSSRQVLLSWPLPEQSYFQLEMLSSGERYFVIPQRRPFPIESKSVRKWPVEDGRCRRPGT
jgi:hypothetical protein